jgi:tRNA-specific 2-thiouridylase
MPMSATTVAAAMSGGVDSSVAAALTARSGRAVVGFSMKLVDRLAGAAGRYGRCCSPEDFGDARRVADALGFPHYVLDMEDEFLRHVLAPFAGDYAEGRTPSPCIRCNTFLKFGALLERARGVGAERVVTGHYAILEEDPRSGRSLLRKAADPRKDQSYYLFDLSEEQRRAAEFPLGRMRKDEVRETARALGLPTAEKAESMDLCFVPREGSYREVLVGAGLLPEDRGGEITDATGKVLGRHAGVDAFTVGQRRGLAVPSPSPLYVLEIDAPARRVVVGAERELYRERCVAAGFRWIPFDRPGGPLRATVRIRANHEGVGATLRDGGDGRVRVEFDQAQRAVTPGQACVAYDGDLVLGGGWIEEPGALESATAAG